MRKGLSTGRPSSREEARIIACKESGCIACLSHALRNPEYKGWQPDYGCDYHHMLSGGRRRGHRYGIGLCPWHHRAVCDFSANAATMRAWAGPSLMDGSKKFHEAYGSDDELLKMQDELIGWVDA